MNRKIAAIISTATAGAMLFMGAAISVQPAEAATTPAPTYDLSLGAGMSATGYVPNVGYVTVALTPKRSFQWGFRVDSTVVTAAGDPLTQEVAWANINGLGTDYHDSHTGIEAEHLSYPFHSSFSSYHYNRDVWPFTRHPIRPGDFIDLWFQGTFYIARTHTVGVVTWEAWIRIY